MLYFCDLLVQAKYWSCLLHGTLWHFTNCPISEDGPNIKRQQVENEQSERRNPSETLLYHMEEKEKLFAIFFSHVHTHALVHTHTHDYVHTHTTLVSLSQTNIFNVCFSCIDLQRHNINTHETQSRKVHHDIAHFTVNSTGFFSRALLSIPPKTIGKCQQSG